MAENRILPLGFIDRTTEDGAVIMLTRPSDSDTLKPETPLALRSRSRGEPTTTARVRTAALRVVETRTDAQWLEGQQVLRRGVPVYQALLAASSATRPGPLARIHRWEA